MAKVTLGLTSHPLSREENGVQFEIKDNTGAKIGELVISKGGLRWKAKGKHDHGFASWSKFARLMDEANLPRR